MEVSVIEGLISLRAQARKLGSEDAAQALELTLMVKGIELNDMEDGSTTWRRLPENERRKGILISADAKPAPIIQGNKVAY